MDINTFVKINYAILGVSAAIIAATAVYCDHTQKKLDRIYGEGNAMQRNGVVFTFAEIPADQ